jgi:hypothetical protein
VSVLETYRELRPAQFRLLVATTAQVLMEADAAEAQFPPDFMQRSDASMAREIEDIFHGEEPAINRNDVQDVREDEEKAGACAVPSLVRKCPELAEFVEHRYDERRRKMSGAGFELLVGSLVILAIRIKRVRLGKDGASADFESAGAAVKAFVAALVKGVWSGLL